MSIHKPVLLNELRVLLNLKPGDQAIDGTLDGGGHAEMMLELVVGAGSAAHGKVLGIDRDKEILKSLITSENLIVVEGNFANIAKIAETYGFRNVNAVLLDLGMSTWHLRHSGRGFSFQNRDEPLVMNFDEKSEITAAYAVNSLKESELRRIFKEYGEERNAGRVAKKLIEERKTKKIISVGDFLDAIKIKDKKALARIFQGLRIYVNDELENLKMGLAGSFEVLGNKGRLAIISYHSLEDRIVKNFYSAKGGCAGGGSEKAREARIITKKPIAPSREEILLNPSARSARLRVLEKI